MLETEVSPAEPAAHERSSSRAVSGNWWRTYAVVLAVLDGVAMTVGVGVAQAVRFGNLHLSETSTSELSFGVVAALMVPAWVLTMALGGAYERRVLGSGSEEYRRVFDAAVRFLALVAIVAFVRQIDVARAFVAIAIPLAALLTLLHRYLLRRWLHRQRRRGRLSRKVLVVGSEANVTEVIGSLRRNAHAGLCPVAACVPTRLDVLSADGGHLPVVSRPDAVVEGLVATGADVVVVADTTVISNGSLRTLAWQLEGTGVDLMVAPAVTDLAGPRISIRPVSDLPLLKVEEPELKGFRRLAKEAVDRILAAVCLFVLSPLLVVVGLAVRLTSRGPALFRQVRVGLGGRHFVMYKFRTMVVDAEARLPTVAHLNEHDGVLFKIREDPRVTRVGRFLRRWSIDELPQLWNVLRGDMSIVGPRPPLPSEVERYGQQVRRRLLVKPGLTGLWQVNGRAGLPWEEAVRLDLYYVENWSLSMDAVIIARSVTAVIRGRGAC